MEELINRWMDFDRTEWRRKLWIDFRIKSKCPDKWVFMNKNYEDEL